MKKLRFLVICLSFVPPAMANIKLPKLFNNDMVLQRDHTIPVWGWADPKEKITVRLNNQTKSVTADKTGKWRVDLDAEKAGGPYSLILKGKNTITINNVLIGDVWICSGQSNMEMPIGDWGFINNFKEEIATANYPTIRQFLVERRTATQPQADLNGGEWKVCTPGNAASFSAVAYFFARRLNKELNVPIGLINTSWGGTMIETWISKEAFENSDEFKTMISGMQSLNLDELFKAKTDAIKKNIEKLQGPVVPTPAEIAGWKDRDYQDGGWHTMNVPKLWEQQEPGEIDGVIWLRKTIEISAEDAGKPAIINLAMIDDKDETYLNGEKIGATSTYNAPRQYTIPAGALKQGKNVIAIRVTDTGGGGGMYGNAADIKLTINTKVISLAGVWLYRIESVLPVSVAVGPNSFPTLLYNAMISPLIPFAIKGAIWYQGEANAGRANQYSKAFPLMISDWRKRWQEGDFPFYFVQLASWNADNGNSTKGSAWAELREAQTKTLSLPNTGMAVATDIGDAKDIHPKNKQDVGKRLAEIALHNLYGGSAEYSGPMYQSFITEGNKIIVSFQHSSTGFLVKDKYGYIKGFEIAGTDQKFHYAKAFIDGNKIVVMSDEVEKPVAVRFGWADNAEEDNLFNKEGFPAAPFRTDTWKGVTEGAKYKMQE